MNKSALPPRQREAIAHVADGLHFKNVAERMGITLATVENHIFRAQKTLGIHNVAGLVAWHYRGRIAELEAQLAHLKTFPRHD